MSHVDSTSPVTHVSLCAGYGGIDLGLHRAIPNLRTIAVSEIEAFACANLVAKMEAGLLDPAPIWTDLKTFPWAEFRDRVDILSGGYPCQPFSAAGKRLGAEDPRHLWPFISAGIAAMRPVPAFLKTSTDISRWGFPTCCKTWQDWVTERRGAWRQRVNAARLTRGSGSSSWPTIRASEYKDVGPVGSKSHRAHAGQALPVRGGDAGGGEGELATTIWRRDRQHAGCGNVGEWSTPQDVRPEAQQGSSMAMPPRRTGQRPTAWT
jgi:hypothetical protein